MEDGAKKTVMFGVIVVCLVAAGVIAYKSTRPAGRNLKPFEGKMTWVKCRNPKCGDTYQMPLVEYFKYIEAHRDPGSLATPPLKCKKCGEMSVYRAVKCPKCGKIFEMNSIPHDFADRCPYCGYSQIEVDRKEAAAKLHGGGG